MASTFLYRTNGTASGTTKYTLSFWIKKCANGVDMRLFNNYADSNNNGAVYFDASNNYLNVVDKISGSTHLDMSTSRKFLDLNSWYHIVIAVDTTQGTDSNRFKMYVNGVQETSFATTGYPSASSNLGFQQATSGDNCRIGSHNGDGDYINALLSHVHYTDGYAYAASDFGETDADTGEWKIKTSPSVSYGTNGYFVLKDGAVMTDSSPNSNDFSKNGAGTLTKTEDNPSNNFATLNNLIKNNATFSRGNLRLDTTTSTKDNAASTIGVNAGKWYAEAKCVAQTNNRFVLGVSPDPQNLSKADNFSGYQTDSVAYASDGEIYKNEVSQHSGSSYAAGDIVGIALDLDNNKVYFHKGGTWQNSGDPTSGSTGTGAVSLTSPSSLTTGFYFITIGDTSGSNSVTGDINFGNGFFGHTAIASEGTNASGLGKFEYDVPAGYTALCTKGLNE